MKAIRPITILCLSLCTLVLSAQEKFDFKSNKFADSKRYVVYKTEQPISIDGRADEEEWLNVRFTENFIDIKGELIPEYQTRVKMLWDEQYFYVYAEMEEEHIWGSITQHDDIIFHDNDFEVFIDPDGDGRNYSELEINALNTTWDLLLDKPYRLGGTANDFFEMEGLETAVHIEGTLNNPSDIDRYWSVEMAIPMESILLAKRSRQKFPDEQDIWRVNFSRVEWEHTINNGQYARKKTNGKYNPEKNWVWSPQGEINMHIPELWGYVQFSYSSADNEELYEGSEEELSEHVAYELFRRYRFGNNQVHYTNITQGYTQYIPEFTIDNQIFKATYFKTAHGFEILIHNTTLNKRYLIDETGYLKKL